MTRLVNSHNFSQATNDGHHGQSSVRDLRREFLFLGTRRGLDVAVGYTQETGVLEVTGGTWASHGRTNCTKAARHVKPAAATSKHPIASIHGATPCVECLFFLWRVYHQSSTSMYRTRRWRKFINKKPIGRVCGWK